MYRYKAKRDYGFKAGKANSKKEYHVRAGEIFELPVQLSDGYKDWAIDVVEKKKNIGGD